MCAYVSVLLRIPTTSNKYNQATTFQFQLLRIAPLPGIANGSAPATKITTSAAIAKFPSPSNTNNSLFK